MSLSDQEGDFRELLQRNHARWTGIARSYASIAEREDLLQEILMQVWKSLAGFSGRSSADTWAYRVALNTAMAWARNSRSRQADTNVSEDVDRLSGCLVSETTDAIALDEFLASLSQTDRADRGRCIDTRPWRSLFRNVHVRASSSRHLRRVPTRRRARRPIG